MGIDIDSAKVVTAILGASNIFPTAAADASKLASGLVSKAIKAAASSPSSERRILEVVGRDDFLKIVDGLKGTEIKAVLGKLDKHNKAIKTADAKAQREHFMALVDGGTEPLQAPLKEVKAKAPKTPKPKVERGFSSKAAQAKREE